MSLSFNFLNSSLFTLIVFLFCKFSFYFYYYFYSYFSLFLLLSYSFKKIYINIYKIIISPPNYNNIIFKYTYFIIFLVPFGLKFSIFSIYFKILLQIPPLNHPYNNDDTPQNSIKNL